MIHRASVNGHTALFLENRRLRVGVLPEKGGDIFEFSYAPGSPESSIEFLMRTPWGLKPPGQRPQADFLENYEGGWQELFPNANDACSYAGVEVPFHGEVALLPWSFEAIPGQDTALRLSVDCQRTAFHLERELRVPAGEPRLIVRERVTNRGSSPAHFIWGHHITLGGDFLEEGCWLDTPAHDLRTPDVLYEPLSARLVPG